jgi:hypothetical protein
MKDGLVSHVVSVFARANGLQGPGKAAAVDVEMGIYAGVRQRHSTVIFSDGTNTSGIIGAAITLAGNLSVTVTAAALPGGSKVYSVPVALNDSVTAVHTKIQAVWNADSELTTYYDVGPLGLSVQLTNKQVGGLYPAPDPTLNIAVRLGTAAGITEDLESLETSAGAAGGTSVILTTATAGASIRYTTDGTYPAPAAGTAYTAPFAVPAVGTVVRAAAYKTGLNPGDCLEFKITE